MEKIKNLLIIGFLIVIIFLLWKWWSGNQNYSALLEVNKNLNTLVANNQAEMDTLRDNLVEQDQLVLELTNKQSRTLFENDSLRKRVKSVESRLKFGDVGRIRSVEMDAIEERHLIAMNDMQKKFEALRDSFLVIHQGDSIAAENALNDISFLELPYSFTHSDTGGWYDLGITMTKDSLILDSLNYRNEYTVTYYKKKQKGIFKRAKPVVLIENKNPYAKIKQSENVVVEPKKRFWQRDGFKYGTGTAFGAFLTWLGLRQL